METLITAAAFVLGTVVLVWAAYFAMRAAVGRSSEQETRDLAGSVIFRISALHGLILALVFANEMIDYNAVQGDTVEEATAVADVYNEMWRYGAHPGITETVHTGLGRYLRAAVDEWQALARDRRLTAEAWKQWEVVYQAVLDLEPESARQESLRDHMVAKAQKIAALRSARGYSAIGRMNAMFWTAAVGGIVLVAMAFFTFAPTRLNLLLLSVFGAFNGLVMLFIYAFADPFSAPGRLEPSPLVRLLEGEIGAAAR